MAYLNGKDGLEISPSVRCNALKDIIEKFHFINLDETDSTNNFLKRNVESLPDLTVVTAEVQTAGRGRMGKSFCSPKGTGAYFSILLKNNISVEISKHLTVMSAVAVLEEIQIVTDRDVKIKWVNDVYIDGKKVCGILTEGSVNPQSENLNYAIIGIGINLKISENDFPKDLRDLVTCVFENECSQSQKEKLIKGIICRIYKMLTGEDPHYIDRYRKYSFLDGKKISIISNDSTESATALHIDENCNLVAKKDETGETVTLFSGDVSIKPM